jgi:hypothetical protein
VGSIKKEAQSEEERGKKKVLNHAGKIYAEMANI